MVGGGAVADALTTRSFETSELPPGPVQVRLYAYEPAAVMLPVLNPVLEVDRLLAQPSVPVPPVPTHEVAFVVVHTKVADFPGCSDTGVSVSEMTGAGTAPTSTVWATAVVPPAPVQLTP